MDSREKLKLSIVTIHLNDFEGLKRTLNTLEPVIGSTSVEWIVVDGQSLVEDDSLSVISVVKEKAQTYISEPDEGIYDAMNKGTDLANGEYVMYLNAGDELHHDVNLTELNERIAGSKAGMIWCDCDVRYQDGSQIRVKTRSPAWAWYGMPAFHPAILFRRTVLPTGPYDTRYCYAADYDLVCRMLKSGSGSEHIGLPLSVYYRGGVSDTDGDFAREEENAIRLKHFSLPRIAGQAIVAFKACNAKQAMFSRFFRQLRRNI